MKEKPRAGVAGVLVMLAGGVSLLLGAYGIAAGLIIAGLADLAFDGLKLAARSARRQLKSRSSV